MSKKSILSKLEAFFEAQCMSGKGGLSVGLVVSYRTKSMNFPIDPSELLTPSHGQVSGLGKSNVQSILAEHGIGQVLAEEGGRTSRGSIGKMQRYVEFLNQLWSDQQYDADVIESFWVQKIREHFVAKPFILAHDPSKSLESAIHKLFEQVYERQKEVRGSTIAGTVLQHLVAAKLQGMLDEAIETHGASVADESTGRASDFLVGDVAIHVSTSPNESLMQKCLKNIEGNLSPLIVTVASGLPMAEHFADQYSISDRVEVFAAEKFLAGNIYEHGHFRRSGRRETLKSLVERYNLIVSENETDPSLRIKIR